MIATLNPCDWVFLCGMGAGACLTIVLGAIAWTIVDAVRAFREGSDE